MVPTVTLTSLDEQRDRLRSYKGRCNRFVCELLEFSGFAQTVAQRGICRAPPTNSVWQSARMRSTLKVLVLEDAEADFRLIVRHLRHRGFDADCQRVVRLEELDRALTFERISGYESVGTVHG